MTQDIKNTWFFQHAPTTVWEVLTESELLGQWLMKNDFKAEKGHKFNFFTRSYENFDGIVHCEVLDVQPHHKLTYSWKGGPGNGQYTLETVVTWTLSPKDNGTELSLIQSGFKIPENDFTFAMMKEGWDTHIKDRLTQVLERAAQSA